VKDRLQKLEAKKKAGAIANNIGEDVRITNLTTSVKNNQGTIARLIRSVSTLSGRMDTITTQTAEVAQLKGMLSFHLLTFCSPE
jgi:hypothetical protein